MAYTDTVLNFWIALISQLSILVIFEIERRRIASFSQVVFMLLYAIVFHGVVIILNIGIPIGLLYGPLIMNAYVSRRASSVINKLHFFPFYGFSFFYIILCVLHLLGRHETAVWLGKFYYAFYLFVMPFSMLSYVVSLLRLRINEAFERYKFKDRLLDMLIFLCLGTVLPLCIFTINTLVGMGREWDRLVVYGSVCFGFTVIAHYLFVKCVLKMDVHELIGAMIETCTDQNQYQIKKQSEGRPEAERICECIKEEQLFLNTGLSLDTVAERVGIPKYVCSKLLNEELGESFYQLISKYRIEHAVKLMESDNGKRYTIEWIAYTSGFGCKTSFYRYFKIYKGCMPSEYQRQQNT